MVGRNADLPQSAEHYYYEFNPARIYHAGGVAVDILILLATLGMISLPATTKGLKIATIALAVIGFFLCWGELIWATQLKGQSFVLRELPIRPIGNSGILGAQTFISYLFFRLPSGRLGGLQAVLVKGGLAACFWIFQQIIWDGIASFTRSRT